MEGQMKNLFNFFLVLLFWPSPLYAQDKSSNLKDCITIKKNEFLSESASNNYCSKLLNKDPSVLIQFTKMKKDAYYNDCVQVKYNELLNKSESSKFCTEMYLKNSHAISFYHILNSSKDYVACLKVKYSENLSGPSSARYCQNLFKKDDQSELVQYDQMLNSQGYSYCKLVKEKEFRNPSKSSGFCTNEFLQGRINKENFEISKLDWDKLLKEIHELRGEVEIAAKVSLVLKSLENNKRQIKETIGTSADKYTHNYSSDSK